MRPAYALVPVMLLWSNVHPGFVIGMCLIAAFMAEYAVGAALAKRRSDWGYVLACALALAASALNPNGLGAISHFAGAVETTIKRPGHHIPIDEYLPLIDYASWFGTWALVWLVVGSATAAIAAIAIGRRRFDPLAVLLLAGALYMSFRTHRGGAFFALVSAYTAGVHLEGRTGGVFETASRAQRRVALAMAIAAITAALAHTAYSFRYGLMDDQLFPREGTRMLKRISRAGGVFHPYEWGGYLSWELYPRHRTFIDGRHIGATDDYDIVSNALHGWQSVLDRRHVDAAIYRPLHPYSVTVPPIVMAMIPDPDWSPAYFDGTSIIFIRNRVSSGISKEEIWETLTGLVRDEIDAGNNGADTYAMLGELLMYQGRSDEAMAAYKHALAINPSNLKAMEFTAPAPN